MTATGERDRVRQLDANAIQLSAAERQAIGTGYERKPCPHCGTPLKRQTDPIPATSWEFDTA